MVLWVLCVLWVGVCCTPLKCATPVCEGECVSHGGEEAPGEAGSGLKARKARGGEVALMDGDASWLRSCSGL